MKLKTKAVVLALLCLTFLAFATGCSNPWITPYEINDSENYTVSVKFDANGGMFGSNPDTAVIVDSYNPDELPVNDKGMSEITLLSPDDERRGKNDACSVTRSGYFFVGWYETRNEIKGEDGKITYTYANKWDFEKSRVTLDAKKEYSSEAPVKTLYAAWLPLFELEVYDATSGKLLTTTEFDPTENNEFVLPAWDTDSGTMEMNDFTEREDYTFEAAYLDEALENLIDASSIIHPGEINYENATAVSPTFKIYTTWKEGNWFRIESAKQFMDNASVNGNYEIHADLDFEGIAWKDSLSKGTFTGTIIGNNHTIKNISCVRTSDNVYTGLFGSISESATICDITFENVTVTLNTGTGKTGAAMGILAGHISESATVENVTLKNSTLLLGKDRSDRPCNFRTEDYSLGLVCGMGDLTGITYEGLECKYAEGVTETYVITIDDNTVILTDAPEKAE